MRLEASHAGPVAGRGGDRRGLLALALIAVVILGVLGARTRLPGGRASLYRALAARLHREALADEVVAASDAALLRRLAPLPTRTLPTGDAHALLAALQAAPPAYCVGMESVAWRIVRAHPWFREHYRPLARFAAPDPLAPLTLYAYRPLPFDAGITVSRTLRFVTEGGDAFALTAYRLSVPYLSPGEPLPVTLYWRATTLHASLALSVRLVEPGSGRIRAQHHLPPTALRSYAWPPGVEVVTRHTLAVPPDLPDGPYALQLAFDPLPWGGAEGENLRRAPVTLTNLARLPDVGRVPPTPARPLTATFGSAIAFLGYDLPPWAVAGQALHVVLYWHARAPITTSYKVFVHLLAPGDRLVAQDDSLPVRWSYPTTRWRVGDYVRDDHRLDLPADLPHGDYTLAVGLYAADTGERLPAYDAGGCPLPQRRVVLTRLRVYR